MVVRCPTPRERSVPGAAGSTSAVGPMTATDEPAPRDRGSTPLSFFSSTALSSARRRASSMPACSSNGAGARRGTDVGLRRVRVAAVVEPSEALVLVEDAGDGAVEGRGVGRVERRRGRVDERLERRRRQVVAEELLVQPAQQVGGGVRGAVVGPDPAGEPELGAEHVLQPERVLAGVRRRLLQARYLVFRVGAHDRAGSAVGERRLVGPQVELVRGLLVHDRRGVLVLPVVEREVLELGEQAAALDPADVRRGQLRGQVRVLTVGGQVARPRRQPREVRLRRVDQVGAQRPTLTPDRLPEIAHRRPVERCGHARAGPGRPSSPRTG